MLRICKYCSKTFKVIDYRSRSCSRSCGQLSKWTPEARNNISKKFKGDPKFISLGHLGKHHSIETRKKISKNQLGRLSGSKHPRWIEDRGKLKRISKQGERRTSAYSYWRKCVWERDSFKCKIKNKDCSGHIEAHHILGWRSYPELRYNINNGITLCHAHHPRKRIDEQRFIPIFQELVKDQMN